MMTEYDERVEDYWKISHCIFFVIMIDDAGLKDEVKKLKNTPLHIGAFMLSNSEKFMNNFKHAIDGVYTNDLYYEDSIVY